LKNTVAPSLPSAQCQIKNGSDVKVAAAALESISSKTCSPSVVALHYAGKEPF
jgi:hypothetical protein